MTPTTSSVLATAIKDAIEAVVPTGGGLPWVYTPGEREQGTALHLLDDPVRHFDLIFEPGTESRNWYGNGVAYTCLLRIATSYGATLAPARDHLIMADGVDLIRMFMLIADPTVDGFAYAVHQRTGPTWTDDPPTTAMVEHLFEIHWSQSIA